MAQSLCEVNRIEESATAFYEAWVLCEVGGDASLKKEIALTMIPVFEFLRKEHYQEVARKGDLLEGGQGGPVQVVQHPVLVEIFLKEIQRRLDSTGHGAGRVVNEGAVGGRGIVAARKIRCGEILSMEAPARLIRFERGCGVHVIHSFQRFMAQTLQRDLFETWMCFQLQPGNHPQEFHRLQEREETRPFESLSQEIAALCNESASQMLCSASGRDDVAEAVLVLLHIMNINGMTYIVEDDGDEEKSADQKQSFSAFVLLGSLFNHSCLHGNILRHGAW